MDAEFIWYRARSTDGWVWINKTQVAHIDQFSQNGLRVVMSSGQTFLFHDRWILATLKVLGIKEVKGE